AARLFGAADRHLRAIPHIMPRSIGEGYDRVLDDLRRALGDAALDAAWTAGSEMTLDDALALALRSGDRSSSPGRVDDRKEVERLAVGRQAEDLGDGDIVEGSDRDRTEAESGGL
ncbi:MAG: hypothetical protein MUQ27_01895, partial [Acidimicrobiia bacterium]|nr:hypothetical protein [Acidimicrobiia bacterium]